MTFIYDANFLKLCLNKHLAQFKHQEKLYKTKQHTSEVRIVAYRPNIKTLMKLTGYKYGNVWGQ